MRPTTEWDLSDLEALIQARVTESITIDYKRSEALNDKSKKEIAKDVSAFANSAGGKVVYGLVEENQIPVRIDAGVNPKIYSREWLENVISSNISPRIDGLLIKEIFLSTGNVCYVIDIPAATSRAPHQCCPDHRYYKRHNFQSSPMEDYEVKDVMHRSLAPDIFVKFIVDDPKNHDFGDRVNAVILCQLGSNSSNPVMYASIDLHFDQRLKVERLPQFSCGAANVNFRGRDRATIRLTRHVNPSNHQPIYKEIMYNFATVALWLDEKINYVVGFDVASPGLRKQQFGILYGESKKLEMDGEFRFDSNKISWE